MTKRNDSQINASRRASSKKADRAKKRRLTLEGLETRQLMAVLTSIPNAPAPTNLPVFDAPRNVGTVPAAPFAETEGFTQTGGNDFRSNADFIPLGNGPGKQATIDVTGNLPIAANVGNPSGFSSDIDTFSFDLRGGDILDVATLGAAGQFAIRDANNRLLINANFPVGGLKSPIQTLGNVNGVLTIPQDGRYFLTVSSAGLDGNYTIGLRTYRPVTESLAFGDAQILYLDFEGDFIDNNLFNQALLVPDLPTFGVTYVPPFNDTLNLIGIEPSNTAAGDQIKAGVYQEVVRIFEDLGNSGSNGDFGNTGVAGDYAIRILTSQNPTHRAWFESNSNDPRMTRMLIGGTGFDIGVPGVFGIAESVDIGNFDMSEFALFALDGFVQASIGVGIAATSSENELTTQFLASVVAHEASHTFGVLHTEPTNTIASISDAGGVQLSFNNLAGVGPDGIFGTLDDVDPVFRDDIYAAEFFSGFNPVTAVLSHNLSSGSRGGVGQTGRVFRDVNRNGADNNEAGLAGVTVYADINNNGVNDSSEPTAVSGADGSFSLTLPPGTVNIRAVTPGDFVPTTPTFVSSGGGNIRFGFSQVVSNITGTVFVDNDGDGIRDAGDGGYAGVYVYADLDGDNRPDLGEPSAISAANGTYALNFPGPGTYTVRVLPPAGFEQTFPSPAAPVFGEHTITFNGTNAGDNFDFGFLSSSDYGDAPDSYGTTVSANGASHAIIAGLRLGSNIDRELNGQPSATANGDDTNGAIDDEDGVQLTTPLGPGDTATFNVNVTNTTSQTAYLQAFIDFNRDGDFLDAGEKFVADLPINSAAGLQAIPVTVSVPANASVGSTFVRFRLSNQTGVGATGFVPSGEVEDYSFPILNAAEIANDDTFSVPRNTLSNQLDVLGNDFQTTDNQLTIDTLNLSGTIGQVVRSNDQKSVFYTPRNGFTGRDVFSYTVVDQFGNRSSATVVVNVTFQSNIPIAVDDSFTVPQNSSQRPLNVLDNDVPSLSGGISITSVTPGSAGGVIQIIGGGQSLRYTPPFGFNGTEEFTYSIQDSAGSVSTARVTVNLLPGSQADDIVDFTIGIFDPVNINTPITNVRVGDEFLLRVSVEDLRAFANPEGVASAFLDLLYTDELVGTLDTNSADDFPFDITFGPLFSRADGLQRANALTPGLIDEVGGVQQITGQVSHNGPAELFTIRMRAISPGVAQFLANPADDPESETVVLAQDTALLVSQLRLGTTELLIVPATGDFSSAIDDAFPDGRDSDGNLITAASAGRSVLDVLGNDNLGPSGTIREFGIVTNPSLGNVFIDDNGTPDNLNDDFISYRANESANGLERFTYVIVTDDNIRSTAEVTISLGNNNASADVDFDFTLVAADGITPISSVNVGDRFGVKIDVEDIRDFNSTFVFAAYMDVLYDQGVIRPANTFPDDEYNFDVLFGPGFEADAGVGTASRPGIIDEFGTLLRQGVTGNNPGLFATLFFDAIAPGTADIIGSPADSFPFQDTLLFNLDDPVDVSDIRYDKVTITVGGGGPVAAPLLQNLALPQDVNNDGSVSPIDALLIINMMSRLGSVSGEGEQGSAPAAPSMFVDVNGDSRLSALDALQVINYLARQSSSRTSGEGELVAPVQTLATKLADDDVSGTVASDVAFAEFGRDLVTDASAPSAATLVSATIVDVETTSDDDDTDVLDLLAGDVNRLW